LTGDLRALREDLREAGAEQGDLRTIDEVAAALRALGDTLDGEPAELQALAAEALEKMQKLELDLRRRVDTTSDQLFLSGSEDVPESSKSLIFEYFRSLSRKTGSGGGGR